MARGKRRRLVPSSSVPLKRKKIDWIERIIGIIQKYPLNPPSRVISEQKKDYGGLNNFKQCIFRKKYKGKFPEELIEASKKCSWFIPYFYPIDWIERIKNIILKYPLKSPSQYVSEEQKKDYGVLKNYKYLIFRKKLKEKLPEELIDASKKCPWFLPFFYPIDWTERIKNIILKYLLEIPSQYVSEEQKKDYGVLKNYKYLIFRKKLKGKLPEELIKASKDSSWFLLWLFS